MVEQLTHRAHLSRERGGQADESDQVRARHGTAQGEPSGPSGRRPVNWRHYTKRPEIPLTLLSTYNSVQRP